MRRVRESGTEEKTYSGDKERVIGSSGLGVRRVVQLKLEPDKVHQHGDFDQEEGEAD